MPYQPITLDSILPADFPHRERLGRFLTMPIDQYVDHCRHIRKNGGRIPALYNRALQEAEKHDKVINGSRSAPPKVKKIEKLYAIDITEVLYYFTDKSDSIAVHRLRSRGIDTLGALLYADEAEFYNISYIGRSTLAKVLGYRDWLAKNAADIVKQHEALGANVCVPADYDKNAAPLDQLRSGLLELAGIIDTRRHSQRYAKSGREATSMRFISEILVHRYVDGLSFAQIAHKLDRTSWHVTKTHMDLLCDLLSGRPVAANVILHPELRRRLSVLRRQALWNVCPQLESDVDTDDTILAAMGLSMIPLIPNLSIFVEAGNKCRFANKAKAVMRTLKEHIIPCRRDKLFSQLRELPEFSDAIFAEGSPDTLMIKNILAQPEIIEPSDDGYVRLRINLFGSDEQRVARIIYDNRGWLTRSQIADNYRRIFGREPHTVNLSNLRKYGIHSSGDLWSYGPRLEPVNRFIERFATERMIFRLPELQQSLRENGYPPDTRIRSYITSLCLVDNLDANHFVLKEHVDDYPQYNWRRPGRTGLTNWILNVVNDILLEHGGEVKADNILNLIERRAQDQGKELYIRTRARAVIPQYCGTAKPFILEGDKIKVNKPVHEKTNFMTIGRRGQDKTRIFEEIRERALSMTADGYPLPLVEFIDRINDEREESVTRNMVVRALTHAHLGFCGIRLVTIDGKVCLSVKKDNPASR